MDYDFWTADGSESQLRAESWSSENCTDHDYYAKTRDLEVMFQAGGKFYSWNMIEGGHWKVNASQDLNTVIELLTTKEDRGLKFKEIHKW